MDRANTRRWLPRALAFSVLALAACFAVLSHHEQPGTRALQPAPLLATSSDPAAFLSTWNTTLTSYGSSGSDQIMLPLVSNGTYDFVVAWGDGTNDTITAWNQTQVTHTYATSGVHDINITGTISGWEFNSGGDSLKLLEISQWGSLGLGNSGSYFAGCANLNLTATDAPDLAGTTTLSDAFAGCTSLGSSGNMDTWDTSSVTDMNAMFYRATSFDQPIGAWNVSSVTDMNAMFDHASSFDQPIGTWNTSSVTDMNWMFFGAWAFDQPIGAWNTSSVTDMSAMFSDTLSFDQPIGAWNTSFVTDVSAMFSDTLSFDQPIGAWNTSSVTDMSYMFDGAVAFDQPIGAWNTSSVTDMSYMFNEAAFDQPIGAWNTSSVTDMSYMFVAATFDQPIGAWNTSSVTNMSAMFYVATSFDQPIGTWNVSSVTDMSAMFRGASAFDQPIGTWNVSSVTDMSAMFRGASAFDQPIGTWDVSHVTNMIGMFDDATLSTANYDALLLGWSQETLQHNVSFDAGNSRYNSAASAARAYIINTYNWTITDGGQANSSSSGFGIAVAIVLAGAVSVVIVVGWIIKKKHHHVEREQPREVIHQEGTRMLMVPSAPRFLRAKIEAGRVILSWQPPASTWGSAITGYKVYRGSSQVNEVLIATLGNVTTFTDTGRASGQACHYRVSAVNDPGEGVLSAAVIANQPESEAPEFRG